MLALMQLLCRRLETQLLSWRPDRHGLGGRQHVLMLLVLVATDATSGGQAMRLLLVLVRMLVLLLRVSMLAVRRRRLLEERCGPLRARAGDGRSPLDGLGVGMGVGMHGLRRRSLMRIQGVRRQGVPPIDQTGVDESLLRLRGLLLKWLSRRQVAAAVFSLFLHGLKTECQCGFRRVVWRGDWLWLHGYR